MWLLFSYSDHREHGWSEPQSSHEIGQPWKKWEMTKSGNKDCGYRYRLFLLNSTARAGLWKHYLIISYKVLKRSLKSPCLACGFMSGNHGSLPWILWKIDLTWPSANHRLWQHIEVHPNQQRNFQENGHEVFDFLYSFHLEWRSRSSKWIQNTELSCLYHYTKYGKNQSTNVWIQANIKSKKKKRKKKGNHICMVRTLEYWMDEIKWLWCLSQQQASIVYTISSKSYENFWGNWFRSFCFLALLWPWIKVKVS